MSDEVVTLKWCAEAAADVNRPVAERVLALIYGDQFHGSGGGMNEEEIAGILGLPLTDVRTALESQQVRGLLDQGREPTND